MRKETMVLPITTDNSRRNSLEILCGLIHWRNKFRKQRKSALDSFHHSHDSSGPRLKEFVREDVYLMDNTNKRLRVNLLANGLISRLRASIPEAGMDNHAIQKIKRDSLKDFMQLDQLNKQFTSEMNRASNRLEQESMKLLHRHKQMQKQSEIQRRQLCRLESSMRSSFESCSMSPLSLAIESGASSVGLENNTFSEFAWVDKDDQSHVKMFKHKGVFQPTNKYMSPSRIESLHISPRGRQTETDSNIHEASRTTDNESPVDLIPKSRMNKKELSVSWSRQRRIYTKTNSEIVSAISGTVGDSSRADSHSNTINPENESKIKFTARRLQSLKSAKNDMFLCKSSRNTQSRCKVETIGLMWKLPHEIGTSEKTCKHKSQSPFVGQSHNLMPVTIALNKEGLSTKKQQWQVKQIQSLSTTDMYNKWIEKIELLKSNESIETGLQSLPNRRNNVSVAQ